MEYPDISKFPLRLRKLAKFISDSGEYMHISEYCREAGFSYDSIRHGIAMAKAKGNNFNALVDKIHHEKLTSFKPRMYKALISEGEKGNCKAIEIFFRLTGDLRGPETRIKSNVQTLNFVLPMPERIDIPEPVHLGNGDAEGGALRGAGVADD